MHKSTEEAVKSALTHRYRIWRIVLDFNVTREEVRDIKRKMAYERRRLAMQGAVERTP